MLLSKWISKLQKLLGGTKERREGWMLLASRTKYRPRPMHYSFCLVFTTATSLSSSENRKITMVLLQSMLTCGVFGWSGKCGRGWERESGTHKKFARICYLLGVNGIRGQNICPTTFAPHVWHLRGKFAPFPPFTPPSKQAHGWLADHSFVSSLVNCW
jgi:hypothetical protein